MCQILKEEIFKSDPKRVGCVLAVFPAWQDTWAPVADCPNYVDLQKQLGRTPLTSSEGMDYLAVTTYFGSCLKNPIVADYLRDSDGGLSRSFQLVDSGTAANCNDSISEVNKLGLAQAAFAKARKLTLTAYEAGQHITRLGAQTSNNDAYDALHLKINRDPRIRDLYIKSMYNFTVNAGGVLQMMFSDLSAGGQYGQWGLAENFSAAGGIDETDGPKAPKLRAVHEAIRANR